MKTRELLETLRPEGYGNTWTPEAWPQYLARIRPHIPTFPPEVIEQWLYRHYSDAVRDYGWIGVERMTWAREVWPVERLLQDIGEYPGSSSVQHWRERFRDSSEVRGGWLGTYMSEKGTWPTPIMVIENAAGLVRPDGLTLGVPYHLMEGHHRLGFLHALAQAEAGALLNEHAVFVAQVELSSGLDYWPLNDGT